MFGKAFQILRIFGFAIRIDPSWFIILFLLTWSLATGWFPARNPGLPAGTYWLMGLAGAAGLFVSIVLHELSHALVARRRGIPMRGITLFLFGGVAEMTAEPSSAGVEFQVAVAGPVASVAVAAACWGGAGLLEGVGGPLAAVEILRYLALLNVVLVVFNLIPAFPLDGGRVLRSVLWKVRDDFVSATKTAAAAGAFFGLFLILLGVLNFVGGNLIGGMWMALIGMFLRGAAQSSVQQVMFRGMLGGRPVLHFATRDVVTVPPGLSVRDLVEDVVYRHHHKLYPVLDEGRLLGCVTTRDVKQLPAARWSEAQVAEITSPCSEENTVRPDEDVTEALGRMSRTGKSRLMVVSPEGQLLGVISLRDLLDHLRLRMELEEAGKVE